MAVLNATSTISPSLLNQFTATFLRPVHESNADKTVTHDKIGVTMPFYPPPGASASALPAGRTSAAAASIRT